MPSPRPLSNLKTVMLSEPITWFTGVNTLFAGLMHEPWFTEKSGWSLHGSVAGGMALVPVVGERWEAVTKTPIYQGYGLTETSPVATLNPFHASKSASIGVPIPGHRRAAGRRSTARRRPRRTRRVAGARPAGHAGLLAASGRNGSACSSDGWLATGDIADDGRGRLHPSSIARRT